MQPASRSHAGVAFPPPLLYAVPLAVGWLLHRWYPLPITTGRSAIRMILAVICILAYILLFFSAFASFRHARTTLIPNRPAAKLVTSGPYRLTRNPMYLSLVALYLAVTLLVNSWWPLILLPLVVLLVNRTVISREEGYLSQTFPADYAAYRARVRRWL
jgi:protein-S-isoprenylcysteine O-methyltransferase Ste14